MRTKVVVNVLFFLFGTAVFAQNGMISGVVRDNTADTTLYRAKIFIKGTALGAYSDMRGNYTIKNVPAGDYQLTVVYIAKGYNQTFQHVIIEAGKTTTKKISLGQEAIAVQVKTLDLSEFVEKTSEAAAVNEIKEDDNVASIVTAEENSKKGDATVGAAVTRVSGVSIEGGKYANIRGLSGRYNKTILNGSEIPGLDPNRNAVQLDLFPTAFLNSIKVIKTFTPDLPGDFSGGLIDIRTKDAPDSLVIKGGLGFSYNAQVHGQDNFLTYKGSNTDFLGYDNGTRALPNDVQTAVDGNGIPTKTDVLTSPEALEQSTTLGKSFNPLIAPTTNKQGGTTAAPIDYSFHMTIGNRIKLKDTLSNKKIGYFIGVNYRRKYAFYDDGQVGRYSLPGQIDEVPALLPERQFTKAESKDNVLVGTLASLNYKYNPNNKLKFSFIHNHSGEKRTSLSVGTDANQPDSELRVTEMDYIHRSINNFQVLGEHKFDTMKLFHRPGEFGWLASGTISAQNQPDYRIFSDDVATLSDGTKNPQITPAVYNLPTRFYRKMNEINSDVKANWLLKISEEKDTHFNIKFGLSNTLKKRRFEETRMEYDGNNANYKGQPNDYTATDNIGILSDGSKGVLIFDVSETQNNYTGIRAITGAYAMADFNISQKLDFVGGVRLENTYMTVTSDNEKLQQGKISENDILPSASFVYHLMKAKKVKSKRDSMKVNSRDMKVRVSYNRTLARPNFREVAPYAVEDFIRKLTLVGNPDLVLTDINNFDVRWELYPRTNELLAVSGFYKQFNNPIGLFSNPAAGNAEFQWKNLEYSTVFGVEVEFKKRLDVIAKELKNFTFGFNVTLVKSITPIPTDELEKIHATDPYRKSTRPMAGQSPYLINSSIEYNIEKSGINMNLSYNIFGDRLTIYSSDGRPDIYEKARPALNFNFSKNLTKRLSLKVSLKNILDPLYTQAYEYKDNSVEAYQKFDDQDAFFSSYKKGRSYGIGLSYLF